MRDPIETLRFENAIKHIDYRIRSLESDGTIHTIKEPSAGLLLEASLQMLEENNPSALQTFIQRAAQVEDGCRMVVDRAVTDMLRTTGFCEVNFTEVPWPAPSVELFFEDPLLPTCLLMSSNGDYGRSLFERHGLNCDLSHESGKQHLFLTYDGIDAAGIRSSYTYHIPETTFPDLMRHKLMPEPFRKDSVTLKWRGMSLPPSKEPQMDEEEQVRHHALLRLAFRCLAYACLPQAVTSLGVGQRKTPHGSNAGVAGRPTTKKPVSHLRLLPTLIREGREQAGESDGMGGWRVAPHDRRMHFRILRHSRWGKRVGQMVLVRGAKIHGGSEEKAVYKVRKVLQ